MKAMKKSDITRQRILDVAASWFRQKGLAFTSLNDLAQAVNVKASSIYYYFGSKDDLIEEVLKMGIEVVHQEVRKAVESMGPSASYRSRIQAAIRAHLESLLGHDDYTAANIINYSHAPEHVRERHDDVRRSYAAYWASLLEGARLAGEIAPDADLSLTRLFLIGSLNWSVEWYDPKRKPVQEIADWYCRMLFDGVGVSDARPLTTITPRKKRAVVALIKPDVVGVTSAKPVKVAKPAQRTKTKTTKATK